MDKVWVVTYWSNNTEEEPIVTVFDNDDAAQNCYKYFNRKEEHCCIDECPVYKEILISK